LGLDRGIGRPMAKFGKIVIFSDGLTPALPPAWRVSISGVTQGSGVLFPATHRHVSPRHVSSLVRIPAVCAESHIREAQYASPT
jgi:hypothetical protein